jgi:uncharacterized protein YecT (DUF1311 family)
MSALHHILLAAIVASGPSSASPVPSGQFVVVAAPREATITNTQGDFRPDDPQLVGRLVTFDGSSVTFDGDYKACAQATRTTTQMAIGQLIRLIFPDHPNYGKVHVARPAEFGLTTAPATIVGATRFRCAAPGVNHGADWTGATLFPVGGSRWALSLIKDHLLILEPATGPIRASFNCAKANTVAEQTICGDRLLAGWDRSVAAAYQDGGGDKADQRAWLAERDKCGADKACLHDSMSLRTLNLLH